MKTSFAFCLAICAWRATAADSVERQFPKTSSVFDSANTQSASFDSANTQSAPFGSTSFDVTTSNNGGFGADGNQGQSDDRQLLIDLFTRFRNMKDSKNPERRSEDFDDVMTSTVTCTFPGDDAPNLSAYCRTLILNSFDALDAGVGSSTCTPLPDGNSIDGNSATVRTLCHYKGKISVLNMVDRKMTWEFLLVKQPDGAWKISHFSVLGDDQGSFAKLKNASTGLLRDAIVSAKQSYPAYNPIFVVAGSGMAGFLSIGIVGAYLIHRRRTYKRVASVSNV